MKNFIKNIYNKLDCFGLISLARTVNGEIKRLVGACLSFTATWHTDYNWTESLRMKATQYSLLLCLTILSSPVFAYQDLIITTDGRLTDISIKNNKLVDVYPLITVMNEKNTLIVHPLTVGSTRICVLKNNKNIFMFNIKITKDETIIDEVEGFDILPIDKPFKDEDKFELDKPQI